MKRVVALMLRPGNRIVTAGMVLGLIGFVLALFPAQTGTAWPFVVVGIACSAIGYAHVKSGHATTKRLAVLGLLCSVCALVLCVSWSVVNMIRSAVDRAAHNHTISYVASGDSTDATVQYTRFPSRVTAAERTPLPWQQDVRVTGPYAQGVFEVTAGPGGGTVSCVVTVDGQVTRTASATGAGATATCDNF